MDIKQLAAQAGMVVNWYDEKAACVFTNGIAGVSTDQLVQFAELVRADEREACAKVCDDLWDEEAKAAANGTQEPRYHDAIECAYAIRARSNEK